MGDMEQAAEGSPYVSYVAAGLREEFQIGFSYEKSKQKKASKNAESAYEHPEVVGAYLLKECKEGRVVGPLNPVDFPVVRINHFGVILNKQPSAWSGLLFSKEAQCEPWNQH